MKTSTLSVPVPEDLSDLSDDELSELSDRVLDRVNELAETDLEDDHDLEELEDLGDETGRIDEEREKRKEAAAARQDRKDRALSPFRGDKPGGGQGAEEEGDEGAGEGEGEGQGQETAAAGTRGAGQASTRRGSMEGLQARRPKGLEPAARGGGRWMTATDRVPDREPGDPFSGVMDVARAICDRRRNFGVIPMGISGERIILAEGAKSITDEAGEPIALTNDFKANFGVIRDLQAQAVSLAKKAIAEQTGVDALVASGAFCTPYTPLYDFFRLAEPQTPFEDACPTVQAPRGGILYIEPLDYQRLYAAVGTQTEAQSNAAAAEGLKLAKPVLHVDCPTMADASVDSISTIVEFGNLQYKTFPEQVAAFLEDLAVALASVKEIGYLNQIDAAATQVTSAQPYGAARSLLMDWTVAAIRYRKRHGMSRGAPMNLVLPDWAIDLIKIDMSNSAYDGFDYLNVTDAQVNAYLAARNLVPIWHNDTAMNVTGTTNVGATANSLNAGAQIAAIPVDALAAAVPPGLVQIKSGGNTQSFITTGAPQGATAIPVGTTSVNFPYPAGSTVAQGTVTSNMKLNDPQPAGALLELAGTVDSYMYAPGTWTRMDGGNLNIGVVRDSVLNQTNDLQIFAEEFTGLVELGMETVKLSSTVCPSGAAPALVTPLSCGSAPDGPGPLPSDEDAEFAAA